MKRNINYLYSFTDNIRAAGAVPSSKVMRCEVCEANATEQKIPGLAQPNAKVFLLERMRMANGIPMIVEKTCIPYYLCPGIEQIDFSTASLYTILRGSYGINIVHAEETIEAVILTKTVSEQLNGHAGRPGYAIRRISYMENGFVCEVTSSLTCADRCVFRLELTGNSRTKGTDVDFERRLLLQQ